MLLIGAPVLVHYWQSKEAVNNVKIEIDEGPPCFALRLQKLAFYLTLLEDTMKSNDETVKASDNILRRKL